MMTDYIFCQTKEDCGAICHIVSWTMDKTIGKAQLSQKVYFNGFHGPTSAMQDAAESLGVEIESVVYGLNGYANAIVKTQGK
tara:strand:- start:259 stop:504 length:246 start_codon:yes stop_codon:yes gene_type:complete